MRSTLVLLLLIAGCYVSRAQSKPDSSLSTRAHFKHNIYVDAAINNLGVSATYTWQFTPRFDMGIGLSSYYFDRAYYGNSRSSVFVDLRPHWGSKKGLFFIFADAGVAINGGHAPYGTTMSPLGVFVALGPGYCYRINKRGMGPYVSAGLYTHSAVIRDKYPSPPARSGEQTNVEGEGVISVGFKF